MMSDHDHHSYPHILSHTNTAFPDSPSKISPARLSTQYGCVDPIPLVIVEGFLGGGAAALWGKFQDHLNIDCRVSKVDRRRVIFARYA